MLITLLVIFVVKGPIIDGKLNDKCWQKAKEIEIKGIKLKTVIEKEIEIKLPFKELGFDTSKKRQLIYVNYITKDDNKPGKWITLIFQKRKKEKPRKTNLENLDKLKKVLKQHHITLIHRSIYE